GGDHGGDVRHRQRAPHRLLAPRPRYHDFRLDRQRVRRGGRPPVHLGPCRARPAAVPDHPLPDRPPAPPSAAPRAAPALLGMKRHAIRKFTNVLALSLSGFATAVGLFFLGAILYTLLKNGLGGMSTKVFTAMTPPPGSSGGLLNAIYGSVVMTVIGILIGGPIGVLAGTYLAEYGRTARISTVIRFVNDVLLSAPSIIVGLFVYELLVVRMGHFSPT